MQIDVVSDTVCPWCFIGKRRLDQAVAERPDLGIEVNWRPYQLDANIPKEGLDRHEYMRAKFGDSERVKGMSETLNMLGAELGIAFAFDKAEKRPNTTDSHRLIRWASSVGVQNAVVEALFSAYFEQGRDIGAAEVLADIAASCGMDRELVEELLASDSDVELVTREAGLAGQMGIQGVPAFVLQGKYMLVGAQDTDVLLRVFDKVQEKESAAAS